MQSELPELLGEIRRVVTGHLDSAGIEGPAREADWLLEEVTGMGRARLLANADLALSGEERLQLTSAVSRRVRGEPLQYILGYTGFYGRDFKVEPAVLIPRPETELLVELALARLSSGAVVLDIGTGSGCIATTLALERPDAHVTAIDISTDALAVARNNADRLGATVNYVEADVFTDEWLSVLPKSIDCLVSNPPYVPLVDRPGLQRELAYEPQEAIFVEGGPAGFISRLADVGARVLKPEGILLIETHAPDAAQGLGLLKQRGYQEAQVWPDLSGRPRVLEGIWTGEP